MKVWNHRRRSVTTGIKIEKHGDAQQTLPLKHMKPSKQSTVAVLRTTIDPIGSMMSFYFWNLNAIANYMRGSETLWTCLSALIVVVDGSSMS
ncbi:uncharacterized protein G2W53_024554 [Senna tora]|uniref:Uncharacterized protein n=1 Tax=Senna tora TaxID=362788 RepID=A0A834TD03_9FABA|nr:uncharacterized protein G2W53_024554 [Senna tora]